MRNANGMGSVYSLSTRKNKRKLRKPWVARVSVNEHGEKQKQKIIGYFETKVEALDALMLYNVTDIIRCKKLIRVFAKK